DARAPLGARRGRAARARRAPASDQALPQCRARADDRRRPRRVRRRLRARAPAEPDARRGAPPRGGPRGRARAHQGRVPPGAAAAQAGRQAPLLRKSSRVVAPAQAGAQSLLRTWVPAFAGTTISASFFPARWGGISRSALLSGEIGRNLAISASF